MLKKAIKQASEDLQDLTGEKDKANINEKNRLQFMKEKDRDISRIIQDDKMYDQRGYIKDIKNN
jgi:hypothetical protein